MKTILKKGFTLAETLVSILLVSAVLVSSLYIASSYYNYTYMRDGQMAQVIENINFIEQIKSEVHSINDLYDFTLESDIRIIAVGVGEINLSKNSDGDIEVLKVSDEGFGFSEALKPNNLYRIEIRGTSPHTKLTSILRIGGG